MSRIAIGRSRKVSRLMVLLIVIVLSPTVALADGGGIKPYEPGHGVEGGGWTGTVRARGAELGPLLDDGFEESDWDQNWDESTRRVGLGPQPAARRLVLGQG